MSPQEQDYLRPKLVKLGRAMGVSRYVGQPPTEAANEFADAALEVCAGMDYLRMLREISRKPL